MRLSRQRDAFLLRPFGAAKNARAARVWISRSLLAFFAGQLAVAPLVSQHLWAGAGAAKRSWRSWRSHKKPEQSWHGLLQCFVALFAFDLCFRFLPARLCDFGINQNPVGALEIGLGRGRGMGHKMSSRTFADPRPFRATDIMAENLFYGGNGVMFYAISRSKCLTLRRHRAGNGIAERMVWICPADGDGNGNCDRLTAACTAINGIQLRINSLDYDDGDGKHRYGYGTC